jgi:hypothetical protein
MDEYTIFRGYHLCELFEVLPNKKDYPDYYKTIKKPIALNTIKVGGMSVPFIRTYCRIGSIMEHISLLTIWNRMSFSW